MQKFPLVSVICTTYNQERYVEKTLDSLITQGYPNLEIKIVDNGSKDGTAALIRKWIAKNGNELNVEAIFRDTTMPYCKSFNQVFHTCNGSYLIDLAGDDVILPHHISKSINRLTSVVGAAACFSDVLLEKPNGRSKRFYGRDKEGKLRQDVPEGNIYINLIARQILLSVSLVFDAAIFRAEGGYDEQLSYEDFDIMVRLARKHHLVFSDHLGIRKLIHSESWSMQQYKPGNSSMLPSTVKVCQKIFSMNNTVQENQALLSRVLFESKHALWSANFDSAEQLLLLAEEMGFKNHYLIKLYGLWVMRRWDLSKIYLLLSSR